MKDQVKEMCSRSESDTCQTVDLLGVVAQVGSELTGAVLILVEVLD